jgi:hypothetical protein
VKPKIARSTNRRDFRQRVYRPRAYRTGRADDQKRKIAAGNIAINLRYERGTIHPLAFIDWNPANGIAAKSKQVGRLLKPRMRFGRGIGQQTRLSG